MSSIWKESCCNHANISINCSYPFVRVRFEQFGAYDLFYSKDDAMFGADSNAGTAAFDCLDSIFDLKVAAVGGEDRIREIVTGSY